MNDSDNGNQQTAGRLKTVFFTGFILCVCFSFSSLRNCGRTPFAQIDNRLNPNTASVYELAELPSIGPAKAAAIAEHRQGNEKAFKNAGDLENVNRIGEKTVEKISKWLEFDNDTD